MPAVAVIPVKSFELGKQRLADALSAPARAALAMGLARHVARTAEEAGLLPLVVTADPAVAHWAAREAIPSIPDPDLGLDAAAGAGVEWAGHSGSRWLVLHSDLPLLTAGELGAFWETGKTVDSIAPSSDGGTSAITAMGPVSFAYGPGSFGRHLARLDRPSVVTSTGLLHDVDSPADLRSVARHPRGRWVRDVIG